MRGENEICKKYSTRSDDKTLHAISAGLRGSTRATRIRRVITHQLLVHSYTLINECNEFS